MNKKQHMIDFAAGTLYDEGRSETYPCGKLPPHILALVQEGGLIEHLKIQRGKSHRSSPEA
ncbi:MAG: hypothetical protein LBB52_01435 [Desulfovibrio sp.]|nr:hypothetical protein [Desulfovibrio sp.]